MKKVKKLLAMIMAMTMVLGMGTLSLAKTPGNDNVYGTEDDRGSISVEGIDYEAGITVNAYQIIEAVYDQTNGNFTGYHPLYTGITQNSSTGDYEVTETTLNSILADIKGESPSVNPERKYEMTYSDGKYANSSVPVGSYLVIIEGAETKVYNPVVVSAAYIVTDGENDIEDKVLDIEENPGWVKVSNVPTIDKTVSDTSGKTETDEKGNSVNVGDNVTYEVTIDPIPNYGGDYPVLNVVDNLSSGLSFNAESLSVKVIDSVTEYERTLTQGTGYTLTTEEELEAQDIEGTFKVDFVVGGQYTLNSYVGDKVVITYTAEVTEKALVNEDGNNNDATLNYTTDSKTTGNGDTDKSKTYTYTFDIDGSTTGTEGIITKTGEGTDEKSLQGAVFGLYTDENCETAYTNDSGTLTTYVKNGETLVNTANTVTSDANGQLYISGLAAGTYYLKELYAPEGYSVNTHVFIIEINATYNDDGTLSSWEVKIDGAIAATFTVDHTSGTPVTTPAITGEEIQNTKIPSLPSTGGIGTTIFTIGGCAIMIAAAALYFVNRRKSEEN